MHELQDGSGFVYRYISKIEVSLLLWTFDPTMSTIGINLLSLGVSLVRLEAALIVLIKICDWERVNCTG